MKSTRRRNKSARSHAKIDAKRSKVRARQKGQLSKRRNGGRLVKRSKRA